LALHVETVGGDAGVLPAEGGVGLRGPVPANDVKSVGRGQGLAEAMEEIDEPHVHFLRLSVQGIAKDMIDPAELVREIFPRLPIDGFELFRRMGVEERELPRGVGSGDFFEGRAGGRGQRPGQDGDSSHPEDMAAAHQSIIHFFSHPGRFLYHNRPGLANVGGPDRHFHAVPGLVPLGFAAGSGDGGKD